jgi:hypothetical protein
VTFNASTSPALTVGSWSSLEIPLTSFTNLTTRANLAQMFITSDTGTAFLDNLYFHK